MRTGHITAAMALTLAGASISATAQDTSSPAEAQPAAAAADQEVYPTGLQPLSPESYRKLPKLGKFRAWLPKAVDLSPLFPAPGNQTPFPNCTAWATAYAGVGYLSGVQLGRRPSGANEIPSPTYVYDRIRPQGSDCKVPTRIVDALSLLKDEGAASLADFPNDPSKCAVAGADMLGRSSALKLDGWRAVDRERPDDWQSPVIIDDIKGALFRKEPVVFTMPALTDFEKFRGPGTYSHLQREDHNWHAMTLVGYDEDRQAFRAINSWGRNWGDGGYIWIGYDTFKRMVAEAYALQQAPGHSAATGPDRRTPLQVFNDAVTNLPCGTVQLEPVAGKLTLTGFAGDEAALQTLRDALTRAYPTAKWDVDLHRWPQCEAESTLATAIRAGGVQLQVQSEAGVVKPGDPVVMTKGDRFTLRAATTAARPFLSIIYLQNDGSAVELYRGKPGVNGARQRAVVIGNGEPEGMQFEVSPPYGSEILLAIASNAPLFGNAMTTYETEREFLSTLRTQLAGAAPGTVAASVVRLQTHE
ncbi:C1 family peptidase [Novosphingobium colocasiae]|uniref:C1 family peptidase n=1 Tax=Novosphingobium colocasiae TaxID=1256513 RepID=UPI0035ADE672